MKYKKQIIAIITLAIVLILMMSTVMQAVNLVGDIKNFNVSMNGSQMKLTWSSVPNSAGYNVYVNGTKIGSVSTNEATLINFTENTTYRLKVIAYDKAKTEFASSDETRFNTTIPKGLEQVQNLTVTQTNGYVTLNWSSVKNADKYQVFVDVPGFGNMNIGEVTTTNAILKDFKDNTRYGFSIRACQTLNSENVSYGEKSETKYITIDFDKEDEEDTDNENNEPIKLDKVTDVRAYNITETTATVSWSRVDNADGYKVLLSKNGGRYKTVEDTSNRKTTLSDLDDDTTYRVKVVAYKRVDGRKEYGDESNSDRFDTLKEEIKVVKPDMPQHLGVTMKNTEASLVWWPVPGADGYEIDLTVPGIGHIPLETDIHYRTIQGITGKDYDYTVRVRAYKYINGEKLYGPYSNVVAFREQ